MSKDSVDLARSLNASSGEQRILNYQSFYGGIWVHPEESPLIEQRWKGRKERWKSDSQLFDPKTHYIAPMTRQDANAFVAREHYLGAGTQGESLRVGLFSAGTPMLTLQEQARPADRLVGVAIFSDLSNAVANRWAKGLFDRKAGLKPLSLSRLVLEPDVAFNGETFFLGAALQLMRQGYRRELVHHGATPWMVAGGFEVIDPLNPGLEFFFDDYHEASELIQDPNRQRSRKDKLKVRAVTHGHRFSVLVSLSDPVPHVLPGKKVLTPGHIGRVYQAFNGQYRGRTDPGTEIWTPKGRPLSGRTLSKIGTQQAGRDAALIYLEQFTGVKRNRGEGLGAYRRRAKRIALESGRLLNISHPGKHVYLWNLDNTGLEDEPPGARQVRQFYGRPGPQLRDVLELGEPGTKHHMRGIPPEQIPLEYVAALARWTEAGGGHKNEDLDWGWVHPLVAYYNARPKLTQARRQALPAVRRVIEGLQGGTLSLDDARSELTDVNALLDHYP